MCKCFEDAELDLSRIRIPRGESIGNTVMYKGSCQITTPNCVLSLGRVRQGWSEVGRSDDNGLECGVGRARGAGVSGGWECALGRTEEAEEEEEE